MAKDDDANLFGILVILLAVLISKQLYDLYKKFTKNHQEVYFVMSDTNCCNPNENPGATDQCQKYCLGKLLSKIRNRIRSSKSSICIAMYNFSNHLFADYVLGAHRRGVKIRLLIDKSASENPENKTQAKRLKNAGKIILLLLVLLADALDLTKKIQFFLNLLLISSL